MSEKNNNTAVKAKTVKTYSIEVAGKKYPYRETMGAMLSFNEETGLEAPVTMKDQLKYMYHVLKSQGRRSDGVPFDLSFEEFTDGLNADDYLNLIADMEAAVTEDEEKNG